MKKLSFLLIIGVVLFFSACKESPFYNLVAMVQNSEEIVEGVEREFEFKLFQDYGYAMEEVNVKDKSYKIVSIAGDGVNRNPNDKKDNKIKFLKVGNKISVSGVIRFAGIAYPASFNFEIDVIAAPTPNP